MALDTSIYGNMLRTPKSAFEYADEFAQRDYRDEMQAMQRQQNALALGNAQAQARGAEESRARQNALLADLRNLGEGATDDSRIGVYERHGQFDAADKIRTSLGTRAKTTADVKKTQAETEKIAFETQQARRMKHLQELVGVNDVPSAMQWLDDAAASGELPQDRVMVVKQQLAANPAYLQEWKPKAIAGGFTLQQQAEQQWKQREFALKSANELIGPDGKPNQQLVGLKAGIARAGAPSVNVNTGQKGLDNEFKLRGEFKQEPVYKAHQEMQAAHGQIKQALSQGTPASDLAAATKIMKLLDPGSVVRESELGMAMAATGLLDRASNYAQNVISGNKLTPKQRQDFQALADALYSESVGAFNAKRAEYDKLGGEYGLNSGRALGPTATQSPQSNKVLRFDAQGNPVQ